MKKNSIITQRSILHGKISVPGDKSVSHRAVIISALAKGTSKIKNLLKSQDVINTLKAFRQMGVKTESRKNMLIIRGRGIYLKKPAHKIDCGNSGTTMRLLAGILAGQDFSSQLIGDRSLSARPMKRVIEPLRLMGAHIKARQDNYAPIQIRGTKLDPLSSPYKLKVASAQVKSCILLAHLFTKNRIELIEPRKTRDHTERMFKFFSSDIKSCGNSVVFHPGKALKAKEIEVPSDISSAAFFIVAAIIAKKSKLLIKKVGINPTRTAIIDVLKKMGAKISITNRKVINNEPVADISVFSSELKGITIRGETIPFLIDEIPILAVAATQAKGRTVIRDAEELRVKETDRIRSMALQLRKMGAKIKELDDGIIIDGPVKLKGASLKSYGDHRTAMSLAVAGMVAEGKTKMTDIGCIGTSFPEFMGLFKKTGAKIQYSK